MNYENLKLFRDIAQTHSFSRGAAMNGISQSAASQHVQELERALAVELLDRSTRPLVVTPAGRLYGEFCRDLLRRKEDFESALQRMRQEVEGTLRVAAIYSVGLSEMVRSGAGVRAAPARSQTGSAVSAAGAHLRSGAGGRSRPGSDELSGNSPRYHGDSVAARGNGAGGFARACAGRPRRPVAPQELDGADFISFDEDLPIRRHMDRFLKEHGVEVNVALHFDNIQMIKEAVTHRVGVSIMPARIMKDEIEQGRLAAVRIADATLFRPLGIIHRKKKRFHRVAQAFLDLLREGSGPEAVAV